MVIFRDNMKTSLQIINSLSMKPHLTSVFIVLSLFILSCEHYSKQQLKTYDPLGANFIYDGRIDTLADNSIGLIGSASSVRFHVSGDSVVLMIQSQYAHGNNFALVINNELQKRYLVSDSLINRYTIHLPSKGKNKIGIYKTSEAATGNLIFHGIQAKSILVPPVRHKKTIEFIGNSITCGAQSDTSEVSCGEGFYHDQHNAYLAYGPRLARALKVNYFVSAVSGIGIYRNWNDENILEPNMLQVYENLYLDRNSGKPYGFKVKPDIVSICLGTNDMSGGDGIKERKEFNKDKFIENYILLIDKIYKHYPKCKIVLLNSPMVSADNKEVLFACLETVKDHFGASHQIDLFNFEGIQPNGCTGHPSIQDHDKMAEQLLPFFKKLMK